MSLASIEQIFLGDSCTCNHSISEEHARGKCFALDYNGLIWMACSCIKIRIKQFHIQVPDDVKVSDTTIKQLSKTTFRAKRNIEQQSTPSSSSSLPQKSISKSFDFAKLGSKSGNGNSPIATTNNLPAKQTNSANSIKVVRKNPFIFRNK